MLSSPSFSLKILSIIFLFTPNWSCAPPSNNIGQPDLTPTKYCRYINAKPSRWLAGDTILINFPNACDTFILYPSTIRLEIPGSKTGLLENEEEFTLKWVPDSTFLQNKNRYAIMTSGFLTMESDTEFVTKTKYWIVQDSGPEYSFQLDTNFFQLDTLPLLSFEELMKRK